MLIDIVNLTIPVLCSILLAYSDKYANADKYFKSLSELNTSLGLKELSIGMSADYMKAINYKATYLRIGSSIFGSRI